VQLVVGVAVFIFAAFVTQNFQSPVGDDLVGVHVGGGPRAALDHVHDELGVVFPIDDFTASLDDGLGDRFGQQTEFPVGLGGSLLDHGQRLDQYRKLSQRNAADIEILQRAQGLYAI